MNPFWIANRFFLNIHASEVIQGQGQGHQTPKYNALRVTRVSRNALHFWPSYPQFWSDWAENFTECPKYHDE